MPRRSGLNPLQIIPGAGYSLMTASGAEDPPNHVRQAFSRSTMCPSALLERAHLAPGLMGPPLWVVAPCFVILAEPRKATCSAKKNYQMT